MSRSNLQIARLNLLLKSRIALALVAPTHAHTPRRGQLDTQRVAEGGGNLLELEDLLGIRLLVNAIERGYTAIFEVLSHGLIGRQHELLDDAVGHVALRARDADHAPEFIKLDFGFRQIKIDGTPLVASLVQNARQSLHLFEVRHLALVTLAGSLIAGKDGENGAVSHALGAADDAGRKLVFHNPALFVNLHQRGHRQAVHVRIETTDAVGKLQRQHGNGAVRKIDRSATQSCFTVERHPRPNVMGHVRNVHLKQIIAVNQTLNVHRVVEIFGCLTVDSDNGQMTEIAAGLAVELGDKLGDRFRLREHLRRELMRQVILADDHLHVDPEFFAAPQDLNHAAARRLP